MVASFTDAQREALMKNHQMSVRVELITAGMSSGPVPFIDGTITATFTSQVTRTGNLRVPLSIVESGMLNPLTDQCVILTGIPGIIETPVFTGRVVSYSKTSDQVVTVQLADTSRDIVRARFEQPWRAVTGATAGSEMVRIVADVSGEIAIDVSRTPDIINPYVVWEEDRGKALDDLASAMSCIWQGDRYGGLVAYPNPYSTSDTPPSAATLMTGPGGTITSITEVVSSENMANSVTVVVERTDNSPPIRVTARDTNPSSPTRWGGPFGKQNIIRKTHNPLTEAAAKFIAFRILNQSLALFRSWQITTPHFPLLDPGDVVTVHWNNSITAQVVESITYPLEAIDGTTLSTRELRQEGEFEAVLGDLGTI
jgi:hypothetical protein